MSHTPGPWHLVDNGHYLEVVVPWKHVPDQIDQYCPKICSVSYEDNDEIVGKPNAQLIAAAPDLLEALRYARRFLKPADHDTAYIDKVIAEATGERP